MDQKHPDPHRQNSLLKAELPSTTKQLRSYLGSYQTFYKCKPRIREVLGPLQALTSNGGSSNKITWTSELIDVFKKSKEELKNLDNLYTPDPNDQLVATFDYSEKGLSGTLWAKIGEDYFTVTNVSVKCPDGMKGWPPCDGEAAAVCVTTKSPHMRGPILASNKPVYALVDNKTVYEASKLLKRGQLSSSERVTKLLTATSDLRLEFRHNSGKLGHNSWDDFHSRKPAECARSDCQVCQFTKDCSNLIFGGVSVLIRNVGFTNEVLSGVSPIPFQNRTALRQLQDEDSDLCAVRHYLLSGKTPGVNDNKKNDIKRYLSAGARIARDGILFVSKVTQKLATFDRIIIPRSLGRGFLLAMHYNLNCPSPTQLENTFTRAFFTLDLHSITVNITENCAKCQSSIRLPKYIEAFNPNQVPDSPGTSFTVDVLKLEKKVILATVENFSGFLITTFTDSEKHADLEDGIITTVLPFKSIFMTSIRVDQAPGFKKLKLKQQNSKLSDLGIDLTLGDTKNKNALSIVDQRMKELEDELRKDKVPLDIAKLQRATSRVNEKIRKENLSAKEIMFKRNQFNQEEIQISDREIKDKKTNDRIIHNEYSSYAKASIKSSAPTPHVNRGHLVFLRQEIDKHSTREVYLVTDVSEDGKHLTVQKLLHVLSRSPAKLQNTKYRVKQTDVIITPNQSFYIDIPSDPPNYDEPIEVDYKHTNLDTDPPTLEIWFTTPLETEQNEVTREQLPLLTTLEPLVAIAPMPGLGQIHYGEEGANPEDNAGSRNLIRPPSPRSVDLSWDNYQSSPTFSHSRHPLSSPPNHGIKSLIRNICTCFSMFLNSFLHSVSTMEYMTGFSVL